jgi:dephospho-CoA kinase
MLLVGLTGGIACGKSTVAQLLFQRGVPLIDADVLAREIVEPGQPAFNDIVAAFGDVLTPEGQLDRKRLGVVVFADIEKRKALEAMTHPRIFQRFTEKTQAFEQKKEPVVVYDAALLFERKLADLMNLVIVVTVPPEVQLLRLKTRDALSDEEALRRITAQMPIEEKVKQADFVIDNSGSREQTAAHLDYVWREVMQRTFRTKA